MEVQTQVIGIVFAICAGMLFLWAVPSYALRLRRRAFDQGADDFREELSDEGPPEESAGTALDPCDPPGPRSGALPPPLPRGKVPVQGFGLVDVVGISLFFGFYASTWFASSQADTGERLSDMENLNLGLLTMLILQGFQIFFVVVLIFGRMNVVETFGLRWRRTWWQVVFAPAVVLSMYAFMHFLQVIGFNDWLASFIEGDGTQEAVKLLSETKDPLTLGLMATVVCIGAPLCEEVVFRGYLYAAVKRFTNIPFAVIFTGLFFGAVHGNLLGLLPLTILGVLLALAYEYTGSLWAPIAIHFCFNAPTTAVQIYRNLNPELVEEIEKNVGVVPLW